MTGWTDEARAAAAAARKMNAGDHIREAARLAMTLGAEHPSVGASLRAAAAAERDRLAGPGQHAVARIAQQHGIKGGPFKVQSLNTKLAGQPWAGTGKGYGRRAVAERVAQHMRTDGGYTRVKHK